MATTYKICVDGIILDVYADETNTHICNSYLLKRRVQMEDALNQIRQMSPDNYAIHKLSFKDQINEWRSHNLLYALYFIRSHTRDVDLTVRKYNGIFNFLYGIMSVFYPHS